MANVTINNLLVNKLAKHFRNEGEDSEAAIAEVLGVTKDIPATVEAYRKALLTKFPGEFGVVAEDDDDGLGEDEEPVASVVPTPADREAFRRESPKQDTAPARRFILRNADGTDTELEVVRETSKAVVLAAVKVRQMVTVILKGRSIDIDLAELRTLPGNTERHGVPVARLIEIAELALA